MKISQTSVDFSVSKELGEMQGNTFQLEDITTAVRRRQVKPGLVTALIGSDSNDEYLQTDVFKYDTEEFGIVLPDGKSYTGFGKDIPKDKPNQLYFNVPSFGLRSNVAPGDYAGRRKPGTTEVLTEEDVVSQMNVKSNTAWELFEELALVKLITEDQNIVRGGPFATYNFYEEIVGNARPAPRYIDFSSTTIQFEQVFREERRKLEEELARAMDSTTGIVVLCGDDFFDKRYEIEKDVGLARPIKFGLDLASQPIAEGSFGATFNYAYFDSYDGLRYINYGSTIIAGQKLIANDMAYMIPLGSSKLIRRAFAPAQTRQYVNSQALSMYGWSKVDDRQGVTTWTESNVLYASTNPRAIRVLTSTAPA